MRSASRPDVKAGHDSGSALVEFVALAVLLCLPLVYVVTAVARVQAASVAATAAAREAGRAYVTAPDPGRAASRARAVADLALRDQGLTLRPDQLRLRCELGPCLAPGSRVRVEVRLPVALPGVPEVLGGGALSVPVSARTLVTVDVFRSRR